MDKIYVIITFVIIIGFLLYANLTNDALKTQISELVNSETEVFEPLTTTFVTAQDWPPVVSVTAELYSCETDGSEDATTIETVERTINNKKYCITTKSEGAAGSIYKTFTYITPQSDMAGSESIKTVFTLRFPQCENYDEPEKTECKNEQENFNPHTIVEPSLEIACYRYQRAATSDAPYTVDEAIRIVVDGNEVTGVKTGTQSGPDMTNGYQGTLTGTISNNILTAVFDYEIEGSSNKEQELYAVTENTLVKHRYPLVENDAILIPDTSKLFNEVVYVQEKCK